LLLRINNDNLDNGPKVVEEVDENNAIPQDQTYTLNNDLNEIQQKTNNGESKDSQIIHKEFNFESEKDIVSKEFGSSKRLKDFEIDLGMKENNKKEPSGLHQSK